MSATDDGGPAFPQPMTFNTNGQPVTSAMYFPDVKGMTLRDYFAAAALQGFVSSYPNGDTGDAEAIAYDSYTLADAMLAARKEAK